MLGLFQLAGRGERECDVCPSKSLGICSPDGGEIKPKVKDKADHR